MPIKSKAQRRKFAQLLVEGKITPETFEEWNRGAGSKSLPERLHPKKGAATRKTAGRRGPERPAKRSTKRAAKRKASARKARARRTRRPSRKR
jgi:hypothetical protein